MRHRNFLVSWLCLLLVVCSGCGLTEKSRKQRHFNKGVSYEQKGKYAEASIEFLNAIQLDPLYTPAHYELAKVALKLGDTETARLEFQQTVDQDPSVLDAHVQLGNLLVKRGDIKGARTHASFVLSKNDGNAGAHAVMAWVEAADKNIDEAQKQANRALELAPASPESYLALANIQLLRNDVSGAEASYATALKANPDSLELRLALGDLYMTVGRWPEAERLFQEAVEKFPKRAQPRVGLVYLYLESGDRAKAEQTAIETKKLLKNDPDAYRVVGDLYIATGAIEKAELEYKELVKEHPRDYRLQKTYVQILILLDHLEEATKLNDVYLNMFPGDTDALIERAQIMTRIGRANEATSILTAVVARDNGNYLAHYHLGLALRMVRDFAGAEREMREAARLQPTRSEPQLALADIAARRGNMDLLFKTSQKMLADAPNSATGYVLRAMAEFSHKEFAKAEADLQQAIQIDPANPLGYTKLAQYRLSQHNIPAAEDLLHTALTRAPGNVGALEALAAILSGRNELDKALAVVDEQIAKAPDRSPIWVIKGQVLMRARKNAEAQAAFRKAAQLDKLNGDAWLWLGRAQNAGGDRSAAYTTYEQWTQANPYDARGFMMLADLTNSMGQWQRARDLYRKALAIDPENALAANNLAYLLLENGGDTADALTYATMARRGLPDSPVVMDTLGYAYLKNGDLKLAVSLLAKAATEQPGDPGVHFHLGLAYQKTKDWQKARENLEKALQLDPNFAHTAEARKALQQVEAKSVGDEPSAVPDPKKRA